VGEKHARSTSWFLYQAVYILYLLFPILEGLTWLGSIVQKGKFSAGIPIFVSTLNSVLLPTFGTPTMPICKAE